jgi:hypothetical protein
MRSRLGTSGNIGLVKRARVIELAPSHRDQSVLLKGNQLPKAKPPPRPRRVRIAPVSPITDLLPGLESLPELHMGLTREEVDAIHQQATDIVIPYLRARFAAVFCDPPVAFAIGFYAQLRAPTLTVIPKKKLKHAIRRWVERAAYQQALAEGQARHNLDGTVSGHPTAMQIAVAREWLGLPAQIRPRPVLLKRELRGKLAAVVAKRAEN